MAFRASSGRVPAYKSGLSPLLNSLTTIRERICIGSPSSALSVSTHFVSIVVTLYVITTACSSTFSHTPSSRRYFNSSSRACCSACHCSSLPVMTSKHLMNSTSLPASHPGQVSCIPLDQILPISGLFQLESFIWIFFTKSPTFISPSRPFSSIFLLSEHPSRSSSPFFQLLQFSQLAGHPSRSSSPIFEQTATAKREGSGVKSRKSGCRHQGEGKRA